MTKSTVIVQEFQGTDVNGLYLYRVTLCIIGVYPLPSGTVATSDSLPIGKLIPCSYDRLDIKEAYGDAVRLTTIGLQLSQGFYSKELSCFTRIVENQT
jgi:hypothetical protein